MYVFPLDAKAWAALSTALQSCPVAKQTLSIPFMIPLLWVVALYLSIFAKSKAYSIFYAT